MKTRHICLFLRRLIDKNMKRTLSLLLLCALICCAACHRKEKVATPTMTTEQKAKAKNVKVDIFRYEQALFALDRQHLASGVEKIYGQVPEILVAKDCWKDPRMMQSLNDYLADTVIRVLYREIQKQYPNLNELQSQLNSAFKIYLTHFPNASVPKFVTMISGIDTYNPTVWGYDNTIIIDLDMYLGANFKYYSQAHIPKFISARYERKYLATDCFTKVMAYKHLPDKTLVSALDNMLDEGKKLFFTQVMFPDTPEMDILGYSPEKYEWAKKHEGQVWQYLMEKNMIYSKDEEVIRLLVDETPFTRVFGNESPGRIGAYIGLQIIKSYMKQHPETELKDIMLRTDAQKVLAESLYKPVLKK